MLNWHVQHLARLMGAGYRIGIQRQFTEMHTPLADLVPTDRYTAATSKELPLRLIEITSIYSTPAYTARVRRSCELHMAT